MARQPKPWERVDKATGRSRGWYATVGGRQVRLAGPGASKSAAWAELRRVLGGGRERDAERERAPTVRDVFNAYLRTARDRAAAGEITEKAFVGYWRALRHAQAAFGARRADGLAPQDVADWLNGVPAWGPTTRRDYGMIVRAAFNHAVAAGTLARMPLKGLKLPRARRRALPDAGQVATILGAGRSPRHRDVLRFLYLTACRPNEAATLEARHVDADAGVAWVLDKIRHKTGRERRMVPLVGEALDIARRLAAEHPEGPIFRNTRGRPWTPNAIGLVVRKAFKAKGVPPGGWASPYSLRHRTLTDLAGAAPIHHVQVIAGHLDPATTYRNYVHAPEEADVLRESLARVRGGSVEEVDPVGGGGRRP